MLLRLQLLLLRLLLRLLQQQTLSVLLTWPRLKLLWLLSVVTRRLSLRRSRVL